MHFYLIFLALTFSLPLHAQKVVFSAPGNNFGVWRLTHDPHIRDWANRYNTQCFSVDGRFVCYTHYPNGKNDTATVRIFDLHKDEERVVSPGFNPRWAKQNNWLIYSTYNPVKARDNGWETAEPLSLLCLPANVVDGSDIYEADPKASLFLIFG